MNILLFDSYTRIHLLPLTFTRPVAGLRAGISTISEKWNAFCPQSVSYLVPDYLKTEFHARVEEDNILVDGALIPDKNLVSAIHDLAASQMLVSKGAVLAVRLSRGELMPHLSFKEYFNPGVFSFKQKEYANPFTYVSRPWHLFTLCGDWIRDDFDRLVAGRKSQAVSDTNRCIGSENIFIEPGAVCEFSILNASAGPIYIGAGAEIMENSCIRGPFALGEHSTVKMSAKIYGPTSVGPHCKVGGEINNSVFLGYSNKAHDGFLGNSVIGEWCNLGADTNNSNLKNTYEEVKLWSYAEQSFMTTGQQFCGLIMGDHTKCSINTMFNTGTVTGVSCNLFGDGFHRNFIPSFSWGSTAKLTTFQIDKALLVAERVMARRGMQLSDSMANILRHLAENTE